MLTPANRGSAHQLPADRSTVARMRLVADGPLNMNNFEKCLRRGGRGVIIDLSAATFVETYAIVSLGCLGMAARLAGRDLTFIPPRSASATTYLARMDVASFFQEHCDCPTELPEVHHAAREDVLVELQWFNAGANLDPLVDLLFNRLDGKVHPQILIGLIESFWEIGDNLRYHAQSTGGVVAAQVYGRGRPGERITLAIGDTGIGIRQSLRSSNRFRPRDDLEAIDLALQYQVSAIDDPGRGVGLPTTADTVRELGGKMVVRSGGGLRTLFPKRSATNLRTFPIPGTVVGVSIPCR